MVTFEVTQTSDPEFEVKLVVGNTAKAGRDGAEELAGIIYNSAKINNAGGQAFKNQLIESLLGKSGRCRQAAGGVLGTGKAKAVIGETKASSSEGCQDSCCK